MLTWRFVWAIIVLILIGGFPYVSYRYLASNNVGRYTTAATVSIVFVVSFAIAFAPSMYIFGVQEWNPPESANPPTEPDQPANQNDCLGDDTVSIDKFEIDEGFFGGQVIFQLTVADAKLTEDYRVEAIITTGESELTGTYNITQNEFSREDCSWTIEQVDDVGDVSGVNFDKGQIATLNVTLFDESGYVVDTAETTTEVTD